MRSLHLLGTLLLLCVTSLAQADERILDFHSDITVYRNSEMSVTETITVLSGQQQIKHGIYRDFPTQYKDRYGNNYVVGFEVTGVERDGHPEPWHSEAQVNGIRIYIGQEDRELPSGKHTYRLNYRTVRQLGFFSDHDELYWNVTGNGWRFPIDHTSATVSLPADIPLQQTTLDAYTGPYGGRGKDFTAQYDTNGHPYFSTTRPFGKYEGLTIAVGWPIGYITPPSTSVRLRWFLRDNEAQVVGAGGSLSVLLFYLISWWLFGRDPPKGTIIPSFTPPENLSPAAMRYVMKANVDNKVLSAAVINMAVKGYIKITQYKKGYYLSKTREADVRHLSPGEKELAINLFTGIYSLLKLDSSNSDRINKATDAVKNYLKVEFNKAYFVNNRNIVPVGIALALLTVMGSALLGVSEWRMFLIPGVIALFAIPLWFTRWWQFAASTTFLGMIFLFPIGGWMIGLITFLTVLNGLFYALIKAPTRRGRRLMDAIEGFRMYLETAEKDRLNLLNPPELTPELFEKYLPYAVALDVEQQWAGRFTGVLARASLNGKQYSPMWYQSTDWHALGAAGFSSAITSAISSSATPPGSSGSAGGGGGGSSGGGGGGGGGGGW